MSIVGGEEPVGGPALAVVPGEPDPSFDRYARIVRMVLDVPVALVSIVESARQVFPGASGLPEPFQQCRATPLSHSFCQYVVRDERPLVVSDARTDERLRTNGAVTDLGVIAYAGFPLRDHTGAVVGSLCAIDTAPRIWTDSDVALLAELAGACSSELAHRELRRTAVAAGEQARHDSHRAQVLLSLNHVLAGARTLVEVAAAVEEVARAQFGCAHAGLWLRPVEGADAAPSAGPVIARYIENGVSDWQAANARSAMALDESNPIGEVVLRRHPLYFSRRAEQAERYPVVGASLDVEARAFLPLTIAGQTYGALALVWTERREFSIEDRVTIAALTAYTSQALQRVQLIEERTAAAATLQHAMMTELPVLPDLELCARYRTAAVHDEVGGDWYDAVVLPSGNLSLMIGDVSGHDIRAAAVMGQLRSMLRALAWAVDEAPSLSVGRLDRAMRDLHIGGSASLVFLRVEQDAAQARDQQHVVRWTNAGHPWPALLTLDGTVSLLGVDHPNDIPLGVQPGFSRRDQTATVPAGATLLLYTDGLVERRGEDLDHGLARLTAALQAHRDRPLPALIDAVLGELVAEHPDDDVAVLGVRFHPARR